MSLNKWVSPGGATRGSHQGVSPVAALAAVATDGLTVAVALLDDHANVGLHQLSDIHHLWERWLGKLAREDS